jgi:phosphatidylglycerophosphate synthase
VQVHIRPVWAGKASTFLQIVMVSSILIGPEAAVWIRFWPLVTAIIWWATGFCAVLATFVYIYRGIRYIEDFHNTQNNDKSVLDSPE